MTNPLGFVVLARRPNPPHGYTYEPVSAVFPEYPKGLEQSQNVRKSCEDSPFEFCRNGRVLSGNPAPVEYVIGEINERSRR